MDKDLNMVAAQHPAHRDGLDELGSSSDHRHDLQDGQFSQRCGKAISTLNWR